MYESFTCGTLELFLFSQQINHLVCVLSRYAASAAAPYPLGFIHLDLDENTLVMESEAPK